MEKLRQTPSQTIGPFFAYSLTAVQYGYHYNSIVDDCLAGNDTEGERIYITGQIFDGAGQTIPDAIVELWQADANGQYLNTPTSLFKGFGRLGTGTDSQHRFTFTTIKPGSINGQAPHINVILFMRGSLHALHTRLYFSDESNNDDEFYNAIDPERRNTLIAHKTETTDGITYQFNIYVQGKNETVFFEV